MDFIVEGTFMWAVEQMKQGKKVIRKTFTGLKEFDKNQKMFLWDDIEATDWEIYEEPKKTLWDKRHGHMGEEVWCDDVKEALKELLNNWKDYCRQNELYKDVKKVFGEEFLK